MPDRIATLAEWTRFLAGFVVVFLLFHFSPAALASDRAQHGGVVGVIVAAALIGVQAVVFGGGPASAVRSLGIGVPAGRALVAATVVSGLLICVPAMVRLAGTSVGLMPGWWRLVPGFLAQAGIAEEMLFRGYLFGQLRHGRTFGRAAMLSMPPFVLVHLLLFLSMPWPVATASLGLAAVTSFPLAWLFEIGGRTIWAPALLHAVIQGGIKVLVLPDADIMRISLLWMAACAFFPLLVFVVPRVR
jgi:membrane protease YdiL (CAAX protease family)